MRRCALALIAILVLSLSALALKPNSGSYSNAHDSAGNPAGSMTVANPASTVAWTRGGVETTWTWVPAKGGYTNDGKILYFGDTIVPGDKYSIVVHVDDGGVPSGGSQTFSGGVAI